MGGKNFYNTYKTPKGTFKHLKQVIEANYPEIHSARMFYRRCEKYPDLWAIIKNNKAECKGCGSEFDISVKQAGYCSYRCRKSHSVYNINEKIYNDMLKAQNYSCAICKTDFDQTHKTAKQINIDHDHETHKVRGLLCSLCNRSLGLLREDINILNNMINYIKKHKHENY
jgi:hypothetical protein